MKLILSAFRILFALFEIVRSFCLNLEQYFIVKIEAFMTISKDNRRRKKRKDSILINFHFIIS